MQPHRDTAIQYLEYVTTQGQRQMHHCFKWWLRFTEGLQSDWVKDNATIINAYD